MSKVNSFTPCIFWSVIAMSWKFHIYLHKLRNDFLASFVSCNFFRKLSISLKLCLLFLRKLIFRCTYSFFGGNVSSLRIYLRWSFIHKLFLESSRPELCLQWEIQTIVCGITRKKTTCWVDGRVFQQYFKYFWEKRPELIYV